MRFAALLATLVTAIVIIAGNAPAAKAETISHFQTRVQSCLYGQFSGITPIAYRASGLFWSDFWATSGDGRAAYSPGGQRFKGGGNMWQKYGPDVYYYGWWYTTNADGTVQYTGSVSNGNHYRIEDENRILACV